MKEPSPVLPADIELIRQLGQGQRSVGYEGRWRGRRVAIKCYRPEFIAKYPRKYGVDIAQFEFDRNFAFHALPGLSALSPEPLRVLRAQDGYTPAFVQEFVSGPDVRGLIRRLGYLPFEFLQRARHAVDTARAHGLHDLDINDGNVRAVQGDDGWRPMIFDFNMMPQHLFAPNPFRKLQFTLGQRDKSFRDYQCLDIWVLIAKSRVIPPA
ncbi:MAG: hypothetical protein ACRETN_11305 [Nevskiales bacterium]